MIIIEESRALLENDAEVIYISVVEVVRDEHC